MRTERTSRVRRPVRRLEEGLVSPSSSRENSNSLLPSPLPRAMSRQNSLCSISSNLRSVSLALGTPVPILRPFLRQLRRAAPKTAATAAEEEVQLPQLTHRLLLLFSLHRQPPIPSWTCSGEEGLSTPKQVRINSQQIPIHFKRQCLSLKNVAAAYSFENIHFFGRWATQYASRLGPPTRQKRDVC